MIYLFVGISLILGFLNAIAERSMEQRGGMRRQIGRRARGADSGREDPEKPDKRGLWRWFG
jgi:hypothetical protein